MSHPADDAAPLIRFTLGERTYWVVSSVDTYRAIAASWPGPDDVVWEIGAATGAATVLIAKRAAAVHAVEKAPEKLEKLRLLAADHPNLHILESDAVSGPRSPVPASLLFVDIGGDAPPWRAMNVAESWADSLQCNRVVVRNTKLHRALLTARPLAGIEASPPPQTPEAERFPDLPVLVERLLEVTSSAVAPRLVESLRNASYRERKRLHEALARLGPAALKPLRELLEDQAAPIAARRAAGETMRRVIGESAKSIESIGNEDSIPIRWASGAEVLPNPLDTSLLLRMLVSEDDLIRHLARNRLRKATGPEVKGLVEALFRPVDSVGNVVKVLDALGATGVLPAATLVEVALDTAGSAQQAVLERLFCSVFGLSDQKWGKELVAALEAAGPARGIAPLPHLSALFSTLQRRPAAARRLLASTAFPPDLHAALAASPHPQTRALTS